MAFIAILDYEMGNLFSVSKALESEGARIKIVRSPEEMAGASGAILPGVGNFGDGMDNLQKRGFASALVDWAASGKPLLGICLGMQMMLESSEEAPGVKGLSLFKGSVRRFPSSSGEKIPHMGWNSLKGVSPDSPFLKGVPEGSFFYFVHSYFADPEDKSSIAASCNYIHDFPAAIGKGDIFATQFHPEKSQARGLSILKNFISRCAREEREQ